jgi:hypothetical protein
MIDGSKVGSHTSAENRNNAQLGETGLEMGIIGPQIYRR